MAVQIPTFSAAGAGGGLGRAGSSLGTGIGQLISGAREDKRREEQEAETQRIRSEGSQLAALFSEKDATRRTNLLSTIAQRATPQFRGELEQLGQLPIEQQNSIIRASLQEDNLTEFLPSAAPSKVGRFRSVDAGDKIQIFDSATGEIIREVQKGTPEAKKIEDQLKIEERQEKIAEKAEKKRLTQQQRNDATKGLVSQAQDGLSLITEIREHPGFSAAVGAKGISSLFGAFDEPIAGTDAAGVAALIDTLESKNFLAGIKEFKSSGGAGSLSDAEGKKIGAAITNLKRSQSEKDFLRNLGTIERLLKKQEAQASKRLPSEARIETRIINFEDL